MYEFTIMNIHDNTERIAYGYNFADACERAKLNPVDWVMLDYEYVD
jgi:hypothetical protein